MHEPDKTEKGIRFGCGFVFGLLLVGIFALQWYDEDGYSIAAMVLVVALVFGFLSMRFGDLFWRRVAQWISWFN